MVPPHLGGGGFRQIFTIGMTLLTFLCAGLSLQSKQTHQASAIAFSITFVFLLSTTVYGDEIVQHLCLVVFRQAQSDRLSEDVDAGTGVFLV